ncbi:MAG: D-cysteine desulfhydrase [Proteobacteria bacterium]|nr:D-cysteine desulfhydrase [Pseudomonadota bacterium]
MNLAQFERRRYTQQATPLEKLEHLSRELGGPDIYIKRDDLLGLAGGGNKTRKLEFLVADALKKGADTLVTVGAIQSNHCRLTLAAAAKEGLKCRLILVELVPDSYREDASGNIFLYRLLGAEKIVVARPDADIGAVMAAEAEEIAQEGRKAYLIPPGGSNPIGTTGYVACAQELLAQSFERGVSIDRVVCASGSAGTQAGLIVGFQGTNSHIPVVGINVSRKKEEQEASVHALVLKTAERLGVKTPIPREAAVCYDDYVGPGYSLPTPEMAEAVRTLARTEGILLDPVYTGKTMAGLIDLVKKGVFDSNENVLFLHTGGSPALYANMEHVLETAPS